MTFAPPPGTAILGNCENLLLPPGLTDADREYAVRHKRQILARLRSIQMNAAGFYVQVPGTLLNELRAAPWAAIDVQATAPTRFSQPIRVTKTTAIGGVEWQAYRAAHPEATLNSIPRARILSVYTEGLGHSVWDLDALKQEERLILFEAALDRKVLVGHNLGFGLSWLFGETAARPSFALDTMILFRQIRPAVLLLPYRWAGFPDQGKQQFAESLLQRHNHSTVSIEYVAACAEIPLPARSFEKVASWCVSTLSADHFAYANSILNLTLQFLRFLLPGVSVEQLPGHIRENQPWYVPFQIALVRLAEGHVRGVAFDPEAARNLMTDLLAEIESAASEVTSYREFAGIKDQLKDPHAGETGDIKRDRRSLKALGSDRGPAWPPFERLQSAKKGLAKPPKYPLLEEMLALSSMALQPTYTIRHAAQLFGVTVRSIQKRVASGELPSRDLPGRAKFLPLDLEQFLRESKKGDKE